MAEREIEIKLKRAPEGTAARAFEDVQRAINHVGVTLGTGYTLEVRHVSSKVFPAETKKGWLLMTMEWLVEILGRAIGATIQWVFIIATVIFTYFMLFASEDVMTWGWVKKLVDFL